MNIALITNTNNFLKSIVLKKFLLKSEQTSVDLIKSEQTISLNNPPQLQLPKESNNVDLEFAQNSKQKAFGCI